MAIVLVYPISNAELERAFSAMKPMLTDLGKSLSTSTIDDLLLIQQVGAPMGTFETKKAVKAWLLYISKRRPGQRSNKGRDSGSQDNGQQEEDEVEAEIHEEDNMMIIDRDLDND